MLSTETWVVIIIALLLLAGVLRSCFPDDDSFHDPSCYKRDLYTCLRCKKHTCKYHKLASKFLQK